MISSALGANVVAIDIDDSSLDLAKSVGASHSINSNESQNVVEEIIEITNGGAHLSIDALGSPSILINSIGCLRKRGRHVQVGIMPQDHTHSKIPIELIIAKELEIVGSHGMQAHRYPQMIQMIVNGEFRSKKN